jgi:hypothetical protein
MKKEQEMEELFRRLENQWDLEEPNSGHQQRFLDKLDNSAPKRGKTSSTRFWKFISIAASLALLISIGVHFFERPEAQDENINQQLSSKPLKVEQTEFYFNALVTKEIEKINEVSGPQTKKLVEDFTQQLTKLEADYKKLEIDLKQKGNVNRILNAMIINFQTRIKLAQDVLKKVTEIEQLKNTKNEEYTI